MSRLTAVRPLLAVLIGSVLTLLVAAAPASAALARATDIVRLRAGVSLAEGQVLVRAAGGRVTGRVALIGAVAARLPERARAALARDPRVAAVSANAAVRSRQSTIDASRLATAYPAAVLAPQAWQSATGSGVGVAVIDTGIDGSLPDFSDSEGTSRVRASVVTNPQATTAADTYGHGTHVAGIIAGDGRHRAADDAAAGKYIGIAPDADLVSIKVDDDAGQASVLDVIYGLQFAVDHKDDYNIRVVNLSLESTVAESYRTDPLDAAVEAAYFRGLVVVAAAGNHGTAPEAANYAPGNDPFAISVGAVDEQGTLARGDDTYAEWSSVGTTQDGVAKPDVSAPGSHIVSTLAPNSAFASLCPSCVVDGNYIRAGGTSMAAPIVSGIAALMLERHPTWTPDEVKSTLLATARNLDGGVDEVNAREAVSADTPSSGANMGIVPNEIVDATTGEIDYTRSSWSRSSWSAAPQDLVAGWARSSWSCACSGADGATVDSTRSSWSRSSWSTRWSY